MYHLLRGCCRALVAGLLFTSTAGAQSVEASRAAVDAALDSLHAAASHADGGRYFDLFTEDAIFLGTDATERWTRDEFMAWARPYFEQGRGWTYVPVERHVYLSADGLVAWFDERLTNENLGDTRGSGVLVRRDGGWRVAQYNLSIPIPNSLAGEVVRRIREVAGAG